MKITLKKLGKWAADRSKEPATYGGLALLASAFGAPALADKVSTIAAVGQQLGLIGSGGAVTAAGVGVAVAAKLIGTGLAAATTRPAE